MTNRWQELWSLRCGTDQKPSLEQAIQLDGFDSHDNAISPARWHEYVMRVARRMEIEKGDSVFEVGCGSGAFLFPLSQLGHRVGGLDYSSTLIAAARDLMPNAPFSEGQAIHLDEEEQYDVVIAHSVFHYFNSLHEAQIVLERMIRKSRRIVGILDVPDLETREECIAARKSAEGADAYDAKYRELEHLYYPRAWFRSTAAELECRTDDVECELPGYLNGRFRFSVALRRNTA